MAAGLWVCVFVLGLCAATRETVTLNVAHGLAGLGGGLAFFAGSVQSTQIAQRHSAAGALGLFYAGPGLGIVFSGLAVPVALKVFGRGSWSIARTVQAGLALVLAIVLMCRRASLRAGPTPVQAGTKQGRICSRMIWLLGGYLIYGAGYVAYMLFMIAWVQDRGREAGIQAAFWAVIGAAAMASPWI
ncbi:YbfB/YjiJ family MFS transporter [Salipiger marinus]